MNPIKLWKRLTEADRLLLATTFATVAVWFWMRGKRYV